jgi:hypothetical protein
MLYIFDKALLTHHFVVLKDDNYNTKASAYCGLNFKKTHMPYGVHCSKLKNKLKLEGKGRLILQRALSKMMERISNCPNNRQEIKELISDFRDV